MKKVLFKLLRASKVTSRIVGMYSLGRQERSYLNRIGWFKSFEKSMPVDKDGNPIPWYTYGAINFLDSRVRPGMTVFEYGSGNSTIWWSNRVDQVFACEHDEQWFTRVKPRLPSHVVYMHFNLDRSGDYSKAINNCERNFDVVIVDGRDRVNCVKNSLQSLDANGVIIFDNSDRDKYEEGYNYLIANGFKRLDFWGIGPINITGTCTSIFYKKENCLDI